MTDTDTDDILIGYAGKPESPAFTLAEVALFSEEPADAVRARYDQHFREHGTPPGLPDVSHRVERWRREAGLTNTYELADLVRRHYYNEKEGRHV